jgi:hypothetical protein
MQVTKQQIELQRLPSLRTNNNSVLLPKPYDWPLILGWFPLIEVCEGSTILTWLLPLCPLADINLNMLISTVKR